LVKEEHVNAPIEIPRALLKKTGKQTWGGSTKWRKEKGEIHSLRPERDNMPEPLVDKIGLKGVRPSKEGLEFKKV